MPPQTLTTTDGSIRDLLRKLFERPFTSLFHNFYDRVFGNFFRYAFKKGIVSPKFTWQKEPFSPAQQKYLSTSTRLSPLRHPTPKRIRLFWATVHKFLIFEVSEFYCHYAGISWNSAYVQLPFGLFLKWAPETSIEEVLSMQAAYDAGLPVPYVLCYGEHPTVPGMPISILMLRMPGATPWKELWDWFGPEKQQQIIKELKMCLQTIRRWKRTEDGEEDTGKNDVICSITGGLIRSLRVPYTDDLKHHIGPYNTEAEFNEQLIECSRRHNQYHREKFTREEWGGTYDDFQARAATLHGVKHPIKFTQGDLTMHNVMVTYSGHLSAIIDWESAGWYPDYWEIATGTRFFEEGFWWREVLKQAMEKDFEKDIKNDQAVRTLTGDWLY